MNRPLMFATDTQGQYRVVLGTRWIYPSSESGANERWLDTLIFLSKYNHNADINPNPNPNADGKTSSKDPV